MIPALTQVTAFVLHKPERDTLDQSLDREANVEEIVDVVPSLDDDVVLGILAEVRVDGQLGRVEADEAHDQVVEVLVALEGVAGIAELASFIKDVEAVVTVIILVHLCFLSLICMIF